MQAPSIHFSLNRSCFISFQHADEVEGVVDGRGERPALARAAGQDDEPVGFRMRAHPGGGLLQHLEGLGVGGRPAADAHQPVGVAV
jgi:hypothetical protein